MSTAEAIETFSALEPSQQLRLLARFSYNLTVAARDTYEVQAERVVCPERLRAINELQHRVLGHVKALLASSSERYPDDVIVPIMLEHTDAELKKWTKRAFQDALTKLGATH